MPPPSAARMALPANCRTTRPTPRLTTTALSTRTSPPSPPRPLRAVPTAPPANSWPTRTMHKSTTMSPSPPLPSPRRSPRLMLSLPPSPSPTRPITPRPPRTPPPRRSPSPITPCTRGCMAVSLLPRCPWPTPNPSPLSPFARMALIAN
uniref:Uncharacterized protein n=1 Tax=Arcella intermedia TaxID=1963864 RepID=A0A6B2LNV6_9EUKA